MFLNFNDLFYPENKYKDKKLTELCPCKECSEYKEYEKKALYGNIAERQYAKLSDSCKMCSPYLVWLMDCMCKLRWYEENDKTLTKGK